MKLFSLIIAVVATIPTAFATPSLYPENFNILNTLNNPTNSNLVSDSDNIHKVYVMPPNSGISQVSGLHSFTANIGFCREMGDLQSYSRQTSRRLRDLSEIEATKSEEYNRLIDNMLKDREELARFAHVENLQSLLFLDDRLAVLESRINDILVTELKVCKNNCSSLKDEYKNLSNERKQLIADRRRFVQENVTLSRKYEQMKQKIEAQEKHIEAKRNEHEKLKMSIAQIRTQFIDMYKDFGSLPGAEASLSFTSSWDQNIEELKLANPGIHFEKIATKDAKISSNIINLESIPTSGAILNYKVGGNSQGQFIEMTSYPDTLSGNVLLSLIGTCPVLHPEYYDINIPTGSDLMKYGLIISYEFPSLFNTNVAVKYNMKKIYEKIVTSSSSGGGFFRRRKTMTSVEERNFFSDSFNVEWKDNLGLSDVEKADREKEMRDRIFTRLAAIGIPYATSTGELKLPEPPKSGALVLSQGLMKSCPGNKICMAVALASDFLDALFGSATAQTSYKNLLDVQMSENWSRTEMVWRPWVTSYN